MKRLIQPLNYQNGDTIVEVMMAIAIVSAVLVGAFVATNRSSQTTRTAQERGEALKWAEAQVELLKAAADTGTPNLNDPSNPTPFCISGTLIVAASTAGCRPGLYRIAITKQPVPSAYVTQVTWSNLSGGSDNNVQLDYKTR